MTKNDMQTRAGEIDPADTMVRSLAVGDIQGTNIESSLEDSDVYSSPFISIINSTNGLPSDNSEPTKPFVTVQADSEAGQPKKHENTMDLGDKENISSKTRPVSPSKNRHTSRILSGSELSPLKILAERSDGANSTRPFSASSLSSSALQQTHDSGDSTGNSAQSVPHSAPLDGPPASRNRRSSMSPRKLSKPENRFPVRVTSPPTEANIQSQKRHAERESEDCDEELGAGPAKRPASAQQRARTRTASPEDVTAKETGGLQSVEFYEDGGSPADRNIGTEIGADQASEQVAKVPRHSSKAENQGKAYDRILSPPRPSMAVHRLPSTESDREKTPRPNAENDATGASATPTAATGTAHGQDISINDSLLDAMEEDIHYGGGADDTVVSTFSTFSAVPSMTMFARMGGLQTPTANRIIGAPGTATRGSAATTVRTPRVDDADTSNLLLDYTGQRGGNLTSAARVAAFRHGAGAGGVGTSPNLLRGLTPARGPQTAVTASETSAGTPRKFTNLIDFDLPPMPTPRSIPTITPRELESLKSSFLSEISGLRASLSGKEAEAASLKHAVADAEKRVGECMEKLRDLTGEREALTAEKEAWESRGREMDKMLGELKQEIHHARAAREELELKLHESEGRREAAEMMAQDAESKMAGMKARRRSEKDAAAKSGNGDEVGDEQHGNLSPSKAEKERTAHEVELAVERVARELHALYKSKHETKVSALKKSYESRWEKRVHELEGRIAELEKENQSLRSSSSSGAGLSHGSSGGSERLEKYAREVQERRARAAQDQAELRQVAAEVRRLEAVAAETQRDNEELRRLLEQERVEKGELVMLAEELMAMQQQQSFIAAAGGTAIDDERDDAGHDGHVEPIMLDDDVSDDNRGRRRYTASSQRNTSSRPTTARTPHQPQRQSMAATTPASASRVSAGRLAQPSAPSSVVRMTGLRAPGTATRGGGGLQRPGGSSGTVGNGSRPGVGGRSGIMSSIERMGQ